MNTGYFLMLAFVVLAGSVSAQTMQHSKSLKREEVPLIIQQSFQKDFSNLTDKGEWKLRYSEDVTTRQLTPEYYTFYCKDNGQKVEVVYKPNGTLDHTKGVTTTHSAAQ